MLNLEQFQNLWINSAPNGFGRALAEMPSYHEYVKREIYKQDYLDLFLNGATFERVVMNNGHFVQITGNLILADLNIPNDVQHVTNVNGNQFLRVDYDYPWDDVQLKVKRYIKYVLVAEAPPAQILNYFYNAGNYAINGGYVTAPYTAICANVFPERKKELLLNFAENGVLLIDLFPFALEYTTEFREGLVAPIAPQNISVTQFFWNDPNCAYNLALRIRAINNLLDPNPRACLILPPTISHYIAGNIINLPPANAVHLGLTFRLNINTFYPPHVITLPPNHRLFYQINHGTILNGIGVITYHLLNIGMPFSLQVPYYSCCCYSGAGTVPHQLFIKNALGLP